MVDDFNIALCLVIAGLLLVYALLIVALRSKRLRSAAQWSLMLVVCLELASFSWQTVNNRDVLTVKEYLSKTGYNDYSIEAIAWLKKTDSGFYRIEKTYSSGPLPCMRASMMPWFRAILGQRLIIPLIS